MTDQEADAPESPTSAAERAVVRAALDWHQASFEHDGVVLRLMRAVDRLLAARARAKKAGK